MRIIRYIAPNSRHPAFNRRSLSPVLWSGFDSEIERLLENALGDFGPTQKARSRVPVDVYQDKDQVYVRAELPGFSREDLDVQVVDGTLTIQANRKAPSANGETAAESSLSLSRSLELPEDVAVDAITATYENGVLNVALPKREAAKPKKIAINVQ